MAETSDIPDTFNREFCPVVDAFEASMKKIYVQSDSRGGES